MKVIYNKYIPFKPYRAINLLGVVFARHDCGKLNRIDLNHEAIHSAQIREMLILPFYTLYLLEWFVRLLQYLDFYKAYRNISFEREAYDNERNLAYLETRKFVASFSYLKKKR